MGLISAVAGRYTFAYDPPSGVASADCGVTEDGFNIEITHAKEVIESSDKYGAMPIEAVHRGISGCFASCTFLEWKLPVLAALFPYQSPAMTLTGATYLGPGTIGTLDTAMAGVGVWSATTGTPAQLSPAGITALYIIIAEGFNITCALNSKLRKLPARFRIYPYEDAGVTKLLSAS